MKMDRQYSWKRTEEMEIDLADLLRRLCMQWRRMVVCALAAAIVLGGYGWISSGDADQEIIMSETGGADSLTEAEKQAVDDAVLLKNEISSLEAYLDSSVLMQIDPYHKNKSVMLYRIDRAARQELPVITEKYLSFLLNGGAADVLQKSGSGKHLDKSCLAELISAYQKTYSSPYQVAVEDLSENGIMAESLFYVEITGRSAKEAEQMALDLQKVLQEYSAEVKQTAGRHRIVLASSMKSTESDSSLQSLQHDRKTSLSANRASLKAVTDAFSQEQMAVYRRTAGGEDSGEQEENAGTEKDADAGGFGRKFSDIKKYLLIGVLAGVFAYACIFSCRYIFGDTIKSIEELKRLYTFPVFGVITASDRKTKRAGAVWTARQDTYGCTKEQVFNRIRLACRSCKTAKLCAVFDFAPDAVERECLEKIAAQLAGCGITVTIAENPGRDTAGWDSLVETGNVLMICKMCATTHRMIDDAMNFYLENGIAVTGTVVFQENE